MMDMNRAEEVECPNCNGAGSSGHRECPACQGAGTVMGQGIKRWNYDDDGRVIMLSDALTPGMDECGECDGWGSTHTYTVQDDANIPEETCPECDGRGEV